MSLNCSKVEKTNVSKLDPRGLIQEAYTMADLGEEQYRSIFLDWVLGLPMESPVREYIQVLLGHYQTDYPNHPMTDLLKEGLKKPNKKRSRRTRRITGDP